MKPSSLVLALSCLTLGVASGGCREKDQPVAGASAAAVSSSGARAVSASETPMAGAARAHATLSDPVSNPAAISRPAAPVLNETDAQRGADEWSVAAWDRVKETGFEKRAALRDHLKEAQARLDIRIQEWEAKKNGLAAGEKTTMEPLVAELRDARDWLVREIGDVDNATAETWTSVKHDLSSAWRKVRAAQEKLEARAGG